MLPAIEAIGAADASQLSAEATSGAAPRNQFYQLLMNGVSQVNTQVADAEALATAFTLDDSIPIHQVTYALEQAKLTTELMMQVRARLLESYQDIMRMQL